MTEITRAVTSEPIDAAQLSAGSVRAALLETAADPRQLLAHWRSFYRMAQVVVDLTAIGLAALVAAAVHLGNPGLGRWPHHLLGVGLIAAWVLVLAWVRAYDRSVVGSGSEEFRRVFDGAIRYTALLGFSSYVFRLPVSRGFMAVALPLGTVTALVGRYGVRQVLHSFRRRGHLLKRVLVLGIPALTDPLAAQFAREPHIGYEVVGALRFDERTTPDRVLFEIRRLGAEAVAATASPGVSAEALRQLGWQLEGTGVSLIVAPALTNIAGPRVAIRPVAGLPLLHVDEPDLNGGNQRLKHVIDRVSAALGLLVLSPLLLLIALAIRLTSSGPALFTQQRLGRNAEPFTIFKFRTMYDGADARFLDLVESQTDNRGGMFVKHKTDPRVTPLGSFLRRWSLDELPQLINVARGDMSLVGPRPLPVAVAQRGEEVRRRLLVRPGLTGLWQVSGRSNLSWEDAVRIDLYYVENWSLSFDFMILWKTIWAVFRGSGAY